MANSELLPCPFCGRPSEIEPTTGEDEGYWIIGCRDDSCIGYHPAVWFVRKEEAIAAWNRRPSTQDREAVSSADYQQRVGAPLTFYAHEADQWWRAEATRDDASTKDCMYAALRHLDEMLAERRSLTPESGNE